MPKSLKDVQRISKFGRGFFGLAGAIATSRWGVTEKAVAFTRSLRDVRIDVIGTITKYSWAMFYSNISRRGTLFKL
ncbi:hypothetical protein PSDVSF_31790 [Pseudodesulfovibrio sediminis]|uniref:Uncharacterized protein n=1 Tax=Pseudodesulfovibrio sediminis TaxID=2810563 RepID=A0ABM7PA89_9BACT|nr:hypothetical protein PSDVSF_31790 [Pseudodesulfovibrio sediminis]